MTTPNTTCLYPHLKSLNAYKHGCRCPQCRQVKSVQAAKFYKNNQAKVLQKTTEYRTSPKGKARRAAYRSTPEGKAHRAADSGKRRAKLQQKQTPMLTEIEQAQIIAVYKQCQDLTELTGVMHHVDHRIPISRGGAHHPANIQILTAAENRKKYNHTL